MFFLIGRRTELTRPGWYRHTGKEYGMFHRQQASSRLPRQGRSCESETVWLSMLVDGFEQASGPDLRGVPCAESVLSALQAQLARSTSPQIGRGSDFRRLH
jgi:hypothetical protein